MAARAATLSEAVNAYPFHPPPPHATNPHYPSFAVFLFAATKAYTNNTTLNTEFGRATFFVTLIPLAFPPLPS